MPKVTSNESFGQTLATLAGGLGFEQFFDYQEQFFLTWEIEQWQRACVYYPTGKGKTETLLVPLVLRGYEEGVVVAPPVTERRWREVASQLGIDIEFMSHARFRMSDTKLSRQVPVVVDEMHLLGGHTGKGWKKLDRLAAGIQAPLLLGSATPNYNDAERCYCIVHVLNPVDHRGGFLGWLYQHCDTEPNPYGAIPIVKGFKNYPDAAAFLADQPNVVYLPDLAPDIIRDVPMSWPMRPEFDNLGYDRDAGRIMASGMERKHRTRHLQMVKGEQLRSHVMAAVESHLDTTGKPTLVFAAHSSIAEVAAKTLTGLGYRTGYVDGKTPQGSKLRIVQEFREGVYDVLVGTATLATGTDGFDRVCDTMIILDDTEDDSLRRQLVGRILPRGASGNANSKVAYRYVYSP